MADFSTPFADNGERREPASDEQSTGFGCGAASLPLFNWMFWAIQAEIGAVIADAGLEPTNSDMTQLLQAIEAKIAAATGDGDTSMFLLMSQARARLPIFPEVNNANGHFGVSSPATGKVRIPSGVSFTHRGIYTLTTTETDFNTDASKIYHLRWNPVDGFVLKDLASSGYNPSSLNETNVFFDSAYDDMLVARVITNSSNVPTITNLKNRNSLRDCLEMTGVAQSNSGNNLALFSFSSVWNWGRTPINRALTTLRNSNNSNFLDDDLETYSTYPNLVSSIPVTRYGTSFVQMRDFATHVSVSLDIGV